MTKFKKTSIAVLSVTMAATIAASQIIAYAKTGGTSVASLQANETVRNLSFNNLTGSLDLSNVSLSQLADTVIDEGEDVAMLSGSRNTEETVIVSFDTPSLVDAKGDDMSVADFLGTGAGNRALKNIQDAQNSFLSKLSAAGISYKEADRYNTVMSGVAIKINTAQFSKIRNFANVSMTGLSKTYEAIKAVDVQKNPSNVYGTGIYDSREIMKKYDVDGSGISVAVLDTGLDYQHDAFSHNPQTVAIQREKVEEVFDKLKAHERNSSVTVDDLYLSKKVPFAFDYADDDANVYPSYSQHGVHVSGIIAGKDDYYINKDGQKIDEQGSIPEKQDPGDVYKGYDFLGVAPEAQIVVCKVFTDDLNSDDLGGATSEDIIAALDDCVTLGVDIINMSLGTSCGFSSITIDGDEEGRQLNEVYTKIRNEGISLITAASNDYSSGSGSEFGTNLASNPDSGTVGSPSTFTGAMSVASINGQEAPYMLANEGESGQYGSVPIYYNESNDANAVPFDFAEEMLGADKESGTFTYLVIPGYGNSGDYSASVQRRLKPQSLGGEKPDGEKIIVLVRRGSLDFKVKVEIAKSMYADGIIVYNNVPGTIRMSLADIEEENRIPSVSIDMDAGTKLTANPDNPSRLRSEGKIKIDKTLKAGPFMNDYSSWGATPDLKLKPDITSHGGEITSTVAGGYEEMSGTSMATPNLAGFMALARSYFRKNSQTLFGEDLTENNSANNSKLNKLLNQIVMSSATLVFDEDKLPYSPRKQGAGLATLNNVFTTKAYLYTDSTFGAEDNRPKIELGEDEAKKGEYTFTFKVKNFDKTSPLTFGLVSRFFTETISPDGLAVAESAHMLTDNPAQFSVDGATLTDNKFTVAANSEVTITVKLTLSAPEKAYIDKNFKNGMYVEGFISLDSETKDQCDLNLPFMGFYGDWEAAPMLDYNAYEISEIEQDTSIKDDEKTHESVFATQLYSTYYNGKYAVPMGGFAYLQDENAEQIYVTEEHCSISRFNIFNGATDNTNYLTSTGVRALYAGLLRNAELVTYDLYDAYTGELIYQGRKFRIGKAYAGGGSARPALVDLRDDGIDTENLPLYNNGKYRLEFNFYMKAADENKDISYQNNFSSNFYVDVEAPILQNARVRYRDYQENNKTKQRVYLDLDIYDNHYPQSVLLCYSDEAYDPKSEEVAEINLATEYVTPIYNPERNTTNTVSIEITDIYEKYKDYLYVQIDDYALNHTVQVINFSDDNLLNSNPEFSLVTNDRVKKSGDTYNLTIEKNEAYKIEINSDANASNYTWGTLDTDIIKVKNGEVFGLAAGSAKLDVTGGATINGGTSNTISIYITVTESNRKLSTPKLSFGVVKGTNNNLEIAQGVVEVNAGRTGPDVIKMYIIPDPWYYPVENLNLQWSSSDETIATVNQKGEVTTLNKHGSTIITAAVLSSDGRPTNTAATVTMRVAEPFDISNMTLNHYYGSDETVYIPNDKNVMYIAEEAFEDNSTMRVLHIPKTVTQINERAFLNCTKLEEVIFDTEGDDLSAISLILADAFQGCKALKKLDLTHVKVLTVGDSAFNGCTNLSEITHMEKIGIAGTLAFANTGLKEVDITGLLTAGDRVFSRCTQINKVTTAHYTNIGAYMFYGCTGLQNITINTPRVRSNAFRNCTGLESVTFGGDGAWENTVFKIDDYAFAGCSKLETVNFGDYEVAYIDDYAFAGTKISQFTMPKGDPVLGESIFDSLATDEPASTSVDITWGDGYENDNGAIYKGTTLIKAPGTINSSFKLKDGTTAIGSYAFTDSTFDTGVETVDISGITSLGEGAFAGAGIKSITIPAGLTVLPESAFRQSKLTSITIPATVTSIGEAAFADCSDLAQVTFTTPDSSELKYIGDGAFSSTKISSIELPDGVETMGSLVFYGCADLTTAKLPSVKSLGAYTFENCTKLATATFGDKATDSGTYTFFPGVTEYDIYGDPVTDKNGNTLFNESSLTSVTLSNAMTELGEGVFYECEKLTSIDLKNVTKIGDGAFSNCSTLATVTGLEKVTEIGNVAFGAKVLYDDNKTPSFTTALKSLNLSAAKKIGAMAFIYSEATSLTLNAAEEIGEQAFAGIKISELNLPSTLKKYGAGAFLAASNLSKLTFNNETNGNNDYFFVKDNVLYRNIENKLNGKTNYELCLYPSNRPGTEYTVIDGTSTIQARAFYFVNARLKTVTLPYSLKTIGVEAFYAAGITTYNFNSINAPALLTEYYSNELESSAFYSMYYANFKGSILDYFTGFLESAVASNMTLGRPDNGIGYDNFIYGMYFGNVRSLGELMDDNTRELIEIIDGFYSLDDINKWLTIDVNDTNKAMVNEFSELVKNAHRMYLNIPTDKQKQFLNGGADREQTLFDVESALRPVKLRFGIVSKVVSAALSPESTVRTQYTEGEKFDMTGIILEVRYDDYFTETVSDLSKIKLRDLYAGELHTYDSKVVVTYEDIPVEIGVTVTPQGENGGDNGSGKGGCGGCSGCGSMNIGTTIGGTGLMLLTFVGVLMVIQKSRRKANKN